VNAVLQVGEPPPLAVVLPFRNAAATLREAIGSLRAQTFARFECQLIDNGSTDTSIAIARATAARDPRFRVTCFDGSFVGALNRGVASSRAPLIARMDADDRAHPQRFALQMEALSADPALTLVGCLVRCFGDRPLPGGMRRYEAWLNALCEPDEIRNALFVESPLAHPSVVFRRAAFDSAGGYRDDGGPEDYDLWMRMLLAGGRARKVPRVLLEWRDSPGRLTRSDPRYAKARFFATKLRHLPAVVDRGRPLQIWGSGATARRWARELRADGYHIRRFVDWIEKRHGSTVQGIPIEPIAHLRAEDGFLLAAVGVAGARDIIVRHLTARGMRAGEHYLAVA
jgi:glycosyltransferase involved in cell wall biosynthesis